MGRPELEAPPDIFYNDEESRKYTQSSRIIKIQRRLTERCLELLGLPEGQRALLLDVGCGSGLSGDVLAAAGHAWIGCDISASMLEVGLERRGAAAEAANAEAMEDEAAGRPNAVEDTFRLDIGTGIPLREGIMDGAVSVSAIQWLCFANTNTQVRAAPASPSRVVVLC